ncbi:MAG TPA: DUF6600 domain-containing protein [Verrucomicrobiae bacterium]|nr:DUF6600 domain-containing protein [Verrucomicrobiae bacterium]
MKIRLLALIGATAGLLLLGAHESAAANVSWSVSVFSGPLGQCGHWIDRPGYGHCWYPAYVASDWRPYCDGYWMWTDCGWYWVSNEPWAWACYHYGRWAYDPYYGWIWIPDTEWGPSWVCWREGGDYVGWAPLPPGSGFAAGGVWREPPVADRLFVFVDINHFSEPVHRRTVIINNTTIFNKTVNVTRFSRANHVVVNNGPDFKAIERVSSRKLTVAPARAVERREVVRPGEPTPKTFKTTPAEQPRRPVKGENREPEIIRGAPSGPSKATAPAESEHEPKRLDKQRKAPSPTEGEPSTRQNPERSEKSVTTPYGTPSPWQNFEGGTPRRFTPTEPDSIQPRQHTFGQQVQPNQSPHKERGAAEKGARSGQEEGKGERQQRGERGG